MASINLFTGENSYALTQEKQRWVTEFATKYGADNITRIQAKGLSAVDFVDDIAAAPFLAEKRLVCIDGIPSLSKEQVLDLPNTIHPDVILLMTTEKIDKRLAASKAILEVAEHKEFTPLTPAMFSSWAQQQLKTYSLTLPADALKALQDYTGANQWQFTHELAKLALLAGTKPITTEDVEALVIPSSEQQVWGLMDIMGQGNSKAALEYVAKLLAQGESAYGVWNILLWMCSCMLPVFAAVEQGTTSPGAVTKQAGISFGAAKALTPLARRADARRVRDLTARVAQYDVELKTGGFKATDKESQELEVLIDRVVVEVCNLAVG